MDFAETAPVEDGVSLIESCASGTMRARHWPAPLRNWLAQFSMYLSMTVLLAAGCHHHEAPLAPTRYASTSLGENPLRGDIVPVHDPSLIRSGSNWYAFTTDLPFTRDPHYLPIRCSPDPLAWRLCGHVFETLPPWIHSRIPSAVGLWAPEISYFHRLYHLYYAASSLGSQQSAIGLATTPTLDPSDPLYRWTDQGEVLSSHPGDDFNAIDPGVLIESDATPPDIEPDATLPPSKSRPATSRPSDKGSAEPAIWLTYGSFWTGIKQRRIDPATGKLSLADPQIYSLAARPYDKSHAIEGAAMVAHNGWYYLFASTGLCCEIPIERDTYRQIVGRSRSVHGPFVGEDGSEMLKGGGTVLLESNALWLAPGGGSVFQDERKGAAAETWLTFHALRRSENGALYLWIKRVTWQDDWPVLRDPRALRDP